MKSLYSKLIQKVNNLKPIKYASNRNFLNGDVSRLSPYISRGIISTKTIFYTLLDSGYNFNQIQKFLQELAWRDYWQKKWQINGNIDVDLKTKQHPVKQNKIPTSIIDHCSTITAIDDGIKELYKTGYMHNHLRMYTAGICCNIGQYHWLQPAKWMYYHLLDGDWGSNALSWQWVAGTNSHKKYIANQENINKYCFTKDRNTFLDKSYPELSEFEKIPLEIKDETEYYFEIELPKKEPIIINNELPTFIYTAYNLDSNWKKEEKANRVFLLEPSHYEKYPVSKKVMDFYILLSKEIEDLQIAVMEFHEFETFIDNHSKIYYKEHPFCTHFNGNKEERDWIFNDLDANGSFFNYWNKGIKNIKLK